MPTSLTKVKKYKKDLISYNLKMILRCLSMLPGTVERFSKVRLI